jgi:hypothetical protein
MLFKQVGQWYVEVEPDTKHGWFEHCLTGAGGGLWFGDTEDVLSLIDYDGVFALPVEVVTAIRDMGCIVEEDME